MKETPLTESERVAGAHVAERALFVTSRRRKTPTGNSMRGKVKFGRRRGSHKREEENPSTRRRLQGTAAKPRQPPPIQCATHPRGGPLQGSFRIRRGIRGHPRVRCAHVVSHVKVLGQSFPYEDRSCYVGHLCERFSSVNDAKNKPSQQESVLRRASVLLAACFKSLSKSDPSFSGVIGPVVHESSYEALLSNMGPAKETRSFADVTFFLAKIGRLWRKDC